MPVTSPSSSPHPNGVKQMPEWKMIDVSDNEQAFFMYDAENDTLHIHHSVDGEPTDKREYRLGE